MASFLMHALVPLLFLLAWRRFDVRKVLLLWPLTIAPDLDYFVGMHRALTANAFLLLPAALGLWRDRARREWYAIALVYLASHLVMDVFDGGVSIFYPLSTWTMCYSAGLDVLTDSNTLAPYWRACHYGGDVGGFVGEGHWTTGTPPVRQVYAWMVPHEVGILAFLAPATGLLLATRWRERRHSRD